MPNLNAMNMLTAQRILAPVISHQQVAPSYYRLQLAAAHIARTAQPGQFVHILPRVGHTQDPLLRRAFSVLHVCDDMFEVLYRIVGKGTEQLSSYPIGSVIDVIGPLGRPFVIPPESLMDNRMTLLVGGGVGVPPLAMLASQRRFGRITALIGARSQQDVLCREEFERYNVHVQVATEDGSYGYKGLVTNLLKKQLEVAAQEGVQCYVYSCGPLAMLQAVAALCRQEEVACQISLEENMPCGIGICNGCVVPVLGAGDEYGRYRRVCVDGPVMPAVDIDWSFRN